MELKNIAIIGAGGRIGAPIVKSLRKHSQFSIIAIVRQNSTHPPPEGTTTRTADFADYKSLVTAFQGQDAVLSCIGAGETQLSSQKLTIDACIEAGVKLYFASEYVADVASSYYRIFPEAIVGQKLQVREYLAEKVAEGKIAWTALNGGPFFDLWIGSHPFPAGIDIPNRKAIIYGTGNNPACWTPTQVLADTAVHMLLHPEPILNKPLFVCGVRGVCQNAIVSALEEELGVKFEKTYKDIYKMKEEALKAFEEGDIMTGMKGMTLNGQFNDRDNVADFWSKVENEKGGVEPVSVKEAVRDLLKALGEK